MPSEQAHEKVYVVNKQPIAVDVVPSPQDTTAFGEGIVAQLTPFVQATATYNFIPANMRTFTATGGSAAATGKEFVVTTGTSVGGYGVIRSFRSLNYKGGMGGMARFTARFTAGVANSQQGAGFFNVGDGFLFGYNGTSFGIIYQHGGKPEVRTVTVTGGAGGSSDLTLTLNTVPYTIPLTAGTAAHNAFEIEAWLNANQTVWSAKQNGDTVVLCAQSDGAKSGTYSFSHATATGTIAQNTAGITKTTEFTAQTAWNIDTAGWLNPLKGNVYQIQYQYLGYGAIEFFVEDPETGRFIPVHRIKYPNQFTEPSVFNPSLHAGIYAASLGSTTNLTAAMASVGMFLQGTPGRTRNPRSLSNVKSIGTSYTSIFTLRNRETINGEVNKVEIEPQLITAFTESARGATIGVFSNATLGGETNYTFLNSANLVTEYDTAATTVTGGTPLLEFVVPSNSAISINLADLRVRIPPTLVVTFAAKVNSGASSSTGIACVLYEDL